MTSTMTANSLRVSRIIKATPDALFRAWTEPAQLRKWWRMDGEGWSTGETTLDLRVGGKYRLGMTGPDGQAHIAIGEYREVRRPDRLVFTWDWDKPTGRLGETVVTIEFKDVGNGATEVVLTHEGFGDEKQVAGHEKGWTQLLSLLDGLAGVKTA
jgi:uncharacterized protein YndB with AHSA1/START domain